MESKQTAVRRSIIIISLIFFALLLATRMSSCSAPKTLPFAKVVEMPSEKLQQGRVLFNEYCATCHPGGMSGLGPGIIDKPLPKFLMKFQIRNGIGAMPAFDENVLNDDEVDKIADYIVYLRKGKKSEK